MMAQIGVQTNDFTVSAVSANPPPGTYPDKQEITLTATDPSAAVFYTTDGRNPLPSSIRYTEPIDVDGSLTIKAMAVDTTGLHGPTATFAYLIEDAKATSLTLLAKPAALRRGQKTTLSGRLASEGAGLAGQRVELEHRPAGSSEFKRIRRAQTRSNGAFSFSGVKPSKNTVYRAVFNGDGSDYEGSVSPTRLVRVRRSP